MMQRYPFAQTHFQLPVYSNAHSKPQLTQREIVEISSDEDEYMEDGQPESSKRTTDLSPKVKRASIVEGNHNEDLNHRPADNEVYSHILEPTRLKRQKLEHVDHMDQYGVLKDDASFTNFGEVPRLRPVPTADAAARFPKLDILFEGLDHGDTRATLAFRPGLPSEAVVNPDQTAARPQIGRDNIPVVVNTAQGKISLERPPYCDDPELGARMYCGPGYERFSIVLGSLPEHQEICDEWDKVQIKRSTARELRRLRRAEVARYVPNGYDTDRSDDDDDDDDSDGPANSTDRIIELECLGKIREVLPDIQREFGLEKIRDHVQAYRCNIDTDIQVRPDPSEIVSDILELSEYPKQPKPKQVAEPAADGTGVTIEWRKSDMENKTCILDAVGLLAAHFDHVPTHFINKTILRLKSLYNSYLHISNLEMNYNNTPGKERLYYRSHRPRVTLEKKYTPKGSDTRLKGSWNDLVNELQAAKQQAERDRLRNEREKEEQALEEVNLLEHKANGDIVECQCCFDDEIPINRAISCEGKDMHWFCFACVLKLAENQVGLMRYTMCCMHQSGCQANLSKDSVGRAVPQRLFDKLALYQQQSEITAACLDGLEQCPFCDFKAICDPIEITSVFQCQNPDCLRVSCRKCHEDTHLPKSCEEVKNDKQVSARHQVEEARSEAMMRSCPKCKVKIIKEIGCNKMRCGMCGCVMCYVCKADISQRRDGGYGHFNEHGAKCALYDKDFDRHEFEANEAEKEAIKRVQAENSDIDEQQLQIETGITKKAAPKKAELRPDWAPNVHAHHRHARANNEAFAAALRQHRARHEEAQRLARHRMQPANVVNNPQRAEPVRALQHQDIMAPPAATENLLALRQRVSARAARLGLPPPPPTRLAELLAPDRPRRPEIPRIPTPPAVQYQHHGPGGMDPLAWNLFPGNPFPERNNHRNMNGWQVEADALPNLAPIDFREWDAQNGFAPNASDPAYMDGYPPVLPQVNPDHNAPRPMHENVGHFVENMFPVFQPPNLNFDRLNFEDRLGRPIFDRHAHGDNVNQEQDGYVYQTRRF